jgi:hypothetical protein
VYKKNISSKINTQTNMINSQPNGCDESTDDQHVIYSQIAFPNVPNVKSSNTSNAMDSQSTETDNHENGADAKTTSPKNLCCDNKNSIDPIEDPIYETFQSYN